ncbi:hypothetical protein [Gallaecimonas sp. GXIMD4217]|uniref:hypothetical protein n=1 Tax=Gallaecimonas sp. GXIMD4217 TaxID=3131927 RepID=UPI00311AE4E2
MAWLKALLLTLSLAPALLWAAPPEPSPKTTYLSNLFTVEEGTQVLELVIWRKSGSAPVVLVTPDGHKIYSARHDEEVRWHDDDSFDLVRIPDPPPGPWQATGKVLPDGIQPFRGIRIGEPGYGEPRYVGEHTSVALAVAEPEQVLPPAQLAELTQAKSWLTSTHDPDADNFAFGETAPVTLTDECPAAQDGALALCAELVLPDLPGQYRWQVETLVAYERKVSERLLALAPPPFEIRVDKVEDPYSPHRWQLLPDPAQVQVDSLRARLRILGGAEPITRRLVPLEGRLWMHQPQQPGVNLQVEGEVTFTGQDGVQRRLSLKPAWLYGYIAPVDTRALTAFEDEPERVALWVWLLIAGIILLIVGTIGLVISKQRQRRALLENAKRLENEQETVENDDFLLDLARPDEIDEKN